MHALTHKLFSLCTKINKDVNKATYKHLSSTWFWWPCQCRSDPAGLGWRGSCVCTEKLSQVISGKSLTGKEQGKGEMF